MRLSRARSYEGVETDNRITCSRCGVLGTLHTVPCLFDEIRPLGFSSAL